MSKGLSEKFYAKSDKAARNFYTQFSSGNYAEFFKYWVEKGYFLTLGYAMAGKEENMRDILNRELCVGSDGEYYPWRALKKMGKLDKLPELTKIVKNFIDKTAQDFEILARKVNEAETRLCNMSFTEMTQRTDVGSGITHGEAIDALFLENSESVSLLEKLKSAKKYLNTYKKYTRSFGLVIFLFRKNTLS